MSLSIVADFCFRVLGWTRLGGAEVWTALNGLRAATVAPTPKETNDTQLRNSLRNCY
jgi:hypothetical protein